MTQYALESMNLTKKLGGRDVLCDVSVKVKQGEIYCFLGANGAGKTTFMKVALGLLSATEGSVLLLGENVDQRNVAVLSSVGSIIETPVFYTNLSARKNMELHCDYIGLSSYMSIDTAFKSLGILEAADQPVSTFSLGMKQRLALARAILHSPKLLILDEPMNGLDPMGIADTRKIVTQINEMYGVTIFLSSHILGEVEKVADTIGFIDRGRLLREMPTAAIRDSGMDLETYYMTLLGGVAS